MINLFLQYRDIIRAAAENSDKDETKALNRFVASARNYGIEGKRFNYENEFPGVDFAKVKAELEEMGMEKASKMIQDYDAQIGRECDAKSNG